MEHLNQCQRDQGESFAAYMKRFYTLSSQMKETQAIREVVKISTMNVKPATWFLSGV